METKIEVVRYRGSDVAQTWASDPNGGVRAAGITGCLRVREGEVWLNASAETDVEDFGIDLVCTFPSWAGGYVVVPGAVYDGNRFRVLELPYPPMYDRETPTEAEPVVTDVPRLPKFHLLSGDASYPAIGLWSPDEETCRVVSFPAKTDLGFVGLRVEEGQDGLTIRIQFPGVRFDGRYTMVNTASPSTDRGASVRAGWHMEARVTLDESPEGGIDELFALLHRNRNRSVGKGSRQELRPLSSVSGLIENEIAHHRWQPEPGFFLTSDSDHGIPFQVGWVGGGIVTLPLIDSEDPVARQRSRANVDFICTELLAPSGYFYGGYRNGPYNDGFDHPHAEHWGMVRKSGDMLLFLMRHILTLQAAGEAIPESWTHAARRCAEAFVRTWSVYGEWGQFIDVRDGRPVIAGSACGGTAIAGMALAYAEFKDPQFLQAAKAMATHYADRCLRPGHLTGGPGEILKAPDSESAFGLVEGYVVLWETTGERRWHLLAQEAARQAASWVVAYDFPFPEDSTFGRMGMRTTGTVIANVQNKHSAPGICTLSALPLLKLYRATGERTWLDLAVEISHSLPQYVSSQERPIYAQNGQPLPPGWVNERVNMSDWEVPERGLGEVYAGPCWSMASVLLTALEMPGIYVDPRRRIVACADHVEARLVGEGLQIFNPTPFDARVKLLIDHDPQRPLGELWWRSAHIVDVPTGECVQVPLG